MSNRTPILTTELLLEAENGDRVRLENLPATVMQALYHELTGRTESISKRYSDNFLIRHGDIVNLVERLAQSAESFQSSAADAQVTVSYAADATHRFSSLTKFQQIDKSSIDVTKSTTIIFSFMKPSQTTNDKFHNYKVIIELNSFILTNSYKKHKYSGFNRYDPPVTIRIEYIDYIIAKSILSMFDDWLGSLEQSKKSDERRWLAGDNEEYSKNAMLGAFSISTFVLLAAIALHFGIYDFQTLGYYILISFAITTASAPLMSIFFNFFIEKYMLYGDFPFVIIGVKDERNYAKFIEFLSKDRFRFLAGFLSFIGAVATNIFAAFLFVYFSS